MDHLIQLDLRPHPYMYMVYNMYNMHMLYMYMCMYMLYMWLQLYRY